jgi:rubrerythrin
MPTTTPEQYQMMLANYSSIVAKTNGELGFWLSLGNWLTTILGIIVAVIAIVAAYAIWKNSYEQKKRFKEFLDSQETASKKSLEEFETLSKRGREEAETKLETLIKEQQAHLKSATADNKEEIRRAINDLKKEKATIGAYVPMSGNFSGGVGYASTVGVGVVGGVAGSKQYRCPACGYTSPFYSKFCPMCGHQGS